MTSSTSPLRSWTVGSRTISFYHSEQKLSACVVQGKTTSFISSTWIEGVPREATLNRERLRLFLKETYVKLVPLTPNGWKVIVYHRMKGGGGDRTLDIALERKLSPQVLTQMQRALEEAKKSEGKSLVAVIGNTGAGKSTVINDLLGVELTSIPSEIPGQYHLVAKEGQSEIAPIGHSLTTPKTLFAQVYESETLPFACADCGGFLDNRGRGTQIVVPLSIMYTLRHAKDVKLIVCHDYNELASSKGQRFAEVVAMTLNTLIEEERQQDAKDSLIFLFTKAPVSLNPIDQTLHTTTRADVVSLLKEFIKTSSPDLAALFSYIIREEGKYVCVYDPLDRNSRSDVLDLIGSLSAIQQPQEAFSVPYSRTTEWTLFEELSAISIQVKDIYTAHVRATEECRALEEESRQLDEEITRLGDLIARLGTEDPQSTKTSLIQTHQEKIQTLARKQKDLEVSIANQEAMLTCHLDDMDALIKRGETEEEVYWMDTVDENERRDVIRDGVHTKVVARFLWDVFSFIPRFLLGLHPAPVTRDPASVTRETMPKKTFEYNGPEISTVRLVPSGGSCWSQESRGPGKFSIVYQPKQGEPPYARVEILVKVKYFFSHTQSRIALAQDIHNLQQLLNHSRADLRDIELKFTSTTSSIDNLRSTALTQETLDEQQQTLQAAKDNVQIRKTKIEESLTALVGEMAQHRDDLTFVYDFVSLCGDTQIKNKPFLQEFIKNYKHYWQMMVPTLPPSQ